MFALLAPLLAGCAERPVFEGIQAITVHHQTAKGTSRRSVEESDLEGMRACLRNTKEIEGAQASDEFLQSVYLLEVRDKHGDRMFELFTSQNFTGNRGLFYENRCIYKLVQAF